MMAQRRNYEASRQQMREAINSMEITRAHIRGEAAPILDVVTDTEASDLSDAIKRLDGLLENRTVSPTHKLRAWNASMAAVTVNTNTAIVKVGTANWRAKQRAARTRRG